MGIIVTQKNFAGYAIYRIGMISETRVHSVFGSGSYDFGAFSAVIAGRTHARMTEF
jgi:hypothetical protein